MTDTSVSLTDLNTADEEALSRQLQISRRIARRVIALRPYQSVEELSKVWGLASEDLERLLSQIKRDAPSVPVSVSENEPAPAEVPSQVLEPHTVAFAAAQAETPPAEPQPKPIKGDWKTSILLVLILLFGAYFRFTGLNWDDGQHQHPDERYISMVIGQIKAVGGVAQYFDTANSVLNPLRFGSYTYGMFPLFFTRMVAEWLGMTDYDTVTLVGRAMSGVFDLLAVWMLYILAKHLYDKRVAFLAAALGAAAVLPIQLSHYFTVDSFSTVFVVAGFYFALRAVPVHRAGERISWSNLIHFGLFGFSIGLAGACKVNTLPVFGIIALAAIARLVIDWKQEGFSNTLKVVVLGFFLSVIGAVLSFRIFQPYAFSGPGFWGLDLNENWLQVIREVVSHVAGNSDWPPNTHWTDRPVSYAWVNMVVWGMGIPLGVTAWLGWAWAFKRIWDGDWSRHFLPLIWVGGYFIWQNVQFWRYMRYFVPIYPFLVLFAAWALIEIYDRTCESRERWLASGYSSIFRSSHWKGALGVLLPVLVLVATYAYAFAFTRIYNRPMTRIAASEWILENIPGPFNVIVQTPAGVRSYPVAVGNRQIAEVGEMASANIHVEQYGTVSQVTATDIRQIGMSFYFSITRDPEKSDIITEGRLAIPDDNQNDSQVISFGDIDLNAGETYYFNYRIQSSSEFSFSDLMLAHVDENLPNLPVDLNMQSQSGVLEGTLPLTPQQPLTLNRLKINGFQQFFIPTQTELKVSIYKDGGESPLAESSQTLSFTEPGLRLAPTFDLSSVELLGGQSYQVRYEILAGAPLRIYGETIALETSWDDALPLTPRRGLGIALGATRACTSASRARRPARVTVTHVPGTSDSRCPRKCTLGSGTSTMPDSVCSKQATSSAAPNRFFTERSRRKDVCRSPSRLSVVSTTCSSARGPATTDSLVTCPTRQIGMPLDLATRVRTPATSMTWATPPARPSTSVDVIVCTESTTTKASRSRSPSMWAMIDSRSVSSVSRRDSEVAEIRRARKAS